MTHKGSKTGRVTHKENYAQEIDKADVPSWDGQELYTYNGMLVWIYLESETQVKLLEFPGHPYDDIIILTRDNFNRKCHSATPEELGPYI